jgi:hypothetical protein
MLVRFRVTRRVCLLLMLVRLRITRRGCLLLLCIPLLITRRASRGRRRRRHRLWGVLLRVRIIRRRRNLVVYLRITPLRLFVYLRINPLGLFVVPLLGKMAVSSMLAVSHLMLRMLWSRGSRRVAHPLYCLAVA